MKPYLPALKQILSCLLLSIAGSCLPALTKAQNVDFGKSYINVTKGLNGGTVENGDTLEIRAAFVVRSGTYDSCAYYDAVPAGTVYIPGTVRVLTNEGKVYKQFTDAVNDDAGWINGSSIRINLGYVTPNQATATRRGRVINTHKPLFSNSCIMIASFRVQVTAAIGSNISTGGGSMTYKSGSNPIQTFTFPANIVRVYQNMGICVNSVGANALGTEFNGTFGNGRPRNRGTSANVPAGYTYRMFTTNTPNDYSYGIANNTSTLTNYTTSNTWAKPDNSSPTHRVFSLWDIIGDHTGAADPYAGNAAADTVTNGNAGYMLVVNAAYRIDSAFQQTITGLCPNTYYEISCWMRNICSKCGTDSNGKNATNATGPPYYIPTAAGDSSGVAPNITFEIDGIDYYSTGNILYTGQWVKKGFTFLTGPAQTSFILKFFNNAPGGGGNDWALDDISVATCSPNMKYSPSLNPIVCTGNALTLYDTVRSYFDNYVYYKWQRSTDGGSSWSDVTAASGPSSPYWNGSDWEYVTSYTVPPANTLLTDSADLYRLVVATTMSNLTDANCRFTDEGNIINMSVIDCGVPLKTQIVSFSGRLNDNNTVMLNWTSDREYELLYFDIEKSSDGVHFTGISTINNHQNRHAELNSYSSGDHEIKGMVYYRIRMSNSEGHYVYSRTIQLSATYSFVSFLSVINPFNEQLQFDVSGVKNGKAEAVLIDLSGKPIKRRLFDITKGVNRFYFPATGGLPPGIYILQLITEGIILQRRVLKLNSSWL